MPRGAQHRASAAARWLSLITKSAKPSVVEHVADGGAQLRLGDRRRRADGVDVALVELAEAALARPVGAPDRLDLVALEELRQLARYSATTRASGTVRS